MAENNVDFAEAILEAVTLVMKTHPHNEPVTWDSLRIALEDYIKEEKQEILRIRYGK